MGSIDHGTQNQTYNFYEELSGEEVNKRHTDMRPRGIYKGGYLILDGSTVKLSILTIEIGNDDTQVAISTAAIATLSGNLDSGTISSGTPYLVLRWAYVESSSNYFEVHAVNQAAIDAIALTNDIVVGKCVFSGSTLTGFDYADRTFLNVQDLFLKVETSSGLYVQLRAGRIHTNSGYVHIPETLVGPFSVPTSPNSRIDLLYIDSDGTPTVLEGSAALSPTTPTYSGKLVVAEITMVTGDTSIPANRIKDVRSFITPNTDMIPASYSGEESVTFPNGFTMKMGKTTLPIGNLAYNGTVSVVFGTSFVSVPKSVNATMKNSAGYAGVCEITTLSKSGFTIRYTESDIGVVEACDGIYWIAVGQ